MPSRRDRAAKLERARTHAERRDHRQPDAELTADQRRNVARDERRRRRKEARNAR